MRKSEKVKTDGALALNHCEPAAEAARDSLPHHLVELPKSQWALWRWVCLRGSGFPFSMLYEMAVTGCAAAADDLLAAESDTDESRQNFAAAIRTQMDITQDGQKRRDLAGLLTALNKGKIPDVQEPRLEPLRTRLGNARQQMEKAQQRFQQAMQSALDENFQKIKQVASDPRFRQALLLQNSKAGRLCLASLQDCELGSGKRRKKQRQSQELIANYLQRYCAKNDSIGFFGPVGWGRFTDDGPNIDVRPGHSLIARSNIYFEHWAIDALAERLAKEVRMRPWMAPRLAPEVCLKDMELTLPDETVIKLSPEENAILARCDAQRTARQIALELVPASADREHYEQDVFRRLDDFVARKIITWRLEVPVVLHPEKVLRDLLNRVEDKPLRLHTLESLDQLEQARDGVIGALGDPDQLDVALAKLDATFTELTDKPATRYQGWNYSGRTVIYQDCLRDLEMEIGPAVLEQLGPPLSLLLTSARWFTYQSAKLYRRLFEETYEQIAAARRSATIDLLPFWIKVRRFITNPNDKLFATLLPEFQQRWAEILQIPEGQRQVQYSSASLRDRVDELFDAPHAGWRHGRYHSPDVMISAANVYDIKQDNYQFVLGEVHMASNTVRPSWAMAQHPHPEEMFDAINKDFPENHVLIVQPKSYGRYSARGRLELTSARNYLIEVKEDSLSWHPPSRTLPITAFVIEPGPTGLIARTRDGRLKFELVEFFGEALSFEAVEYMNPIGDSRHVPRLTIDRLVIQRESWSFPASDLHFALGKDENERFLGARRWQKKHNFPRLVFVRVPVELKPFYVDFDSPLYVENLTKMIRRTLTEKSRLREKPIDVVEMLPEGSRLWLPGPQGTIHTCELRIVALDMKDSC